jgi:ABC-2 type transport system permease protein
MNDVIRSEFRKLRTTRTAFGLLAGTVALTGLALWGSLSSATPAELAAGLTSPFGYAGVVIIIMLFVMVLGIRSFTDEVRHGSIVPTFLATPKRLRVLAAKTTVSAAAAVVFAVLALGVGTGVIAVYLVAHGYAVPVAMWSLAGLFARAIVIAVLWTVIGVSVGVVVRHQVAAIVGALAWLFVIENILGSIVPRIAAWLPGSSAIAAVGIDSANALITPAVGMLVLAAWTAGAVGLAATVVRRRDVV